jgi:UDP-N-acetylglucosamine 2-epimerase
MILVAYGTRPEVIKLFPVIMELERQGLPFQTLFSGQHTDLYEDVKDLVPAPDHSFAGTFAGRKKHNTLANTYLKIAGDAERLFAANRFSTLIVQGDTTTALALAHMAYYNKIRIAHVEAGLRTFDLDNPYPEEFNRTVISQIADFNFAPSAQAVSNLKKSGVGNIHQVGNTVIDAVLFMKRKLGMKVKRSNQVLVTLHRRENHSIMDILFGELQKIAGEYPGLEFILPIHPNPNVLKHKHILKSPNIRVIPPVDYPAMLRIISSARFIISDSGGIQEEATCFKKKIIIVREKTERPEVVEVGLGILAGRDIRPHIEWAMAPVGGSAVDVYGKGDASRKIVRTLKKSAKKS